MAYVSPKQQLKQLGVKVEAGMVLDPEALGMEPHPIYGQLPRVTVLEAKDDGSIFLTATFTCECGEERTIHPGDWFQVRACQKCTKRSRRGQLDEATKALRKAEREAKSAAAKEERNLAKLEAAAKKAQEAAAVAQAKLAERQQRATS